MAGSCTGYHWSHGQYTVSNCTQESSTFFIILGFTMLVLLILFGLVLIIACFRRQRRINAAASSSDAGRAVGSQEDCVIQMGGLDTGAGHFYGKDLESVKCVIMAGEDKPTFLAHPVISFHHPNVHEDDEDEARTDQKERQGETSKQQQQQQQQ